MPAISSPLSSRASTRRIAGAVENSDSYPPDPAAARTILSAATSHQRRRPALPQIRRHPRLRPRARIVLANGTIVRLGGRTPQTRPASTSTDCSSVPRPARVITEATLNLIRCAVRANLAVGFGSMKRRGRAASHPGRRFFCLRIGMADEFTLAATCKRIKSECLRDCRAISSSNWDGPEKIRPARDSGPGKIIPPAKTVVYRTRPRRRPMRSRLEDPSRFSYALRDTGLTKLNEDIVVPRRRLADLFQFAARLQRSTVSRRVFRPCRRRQHHTNVMVDLNQPRRQATRRSALVNSSRKSLRGVAPSAANTASAWPETLVPLAVSKEARDLHRTVKRALDRRAF